MEIKEIFEKREWNEFFKETAGLTGEFLHSWEWGDFQLSLGRKIRRFSIIENKKVISRFLVIKNSLPLKKNYLYCPRGPIFLKGTEFQKGKILKLLKIFFRNLSIEEKAVFFKWDPLFDFFIENQMGKKIKDFQPRQTVILNINDEEDKVFFKMHPKTRYNIRLAKKRGVEVFQNSGKDDFEHFFNLLVQTSQREKFKIYPKEYYRKLMSLSSNFVKVFFARYQGKILAAHLMIFYNKTATYLHGGSSREERQVMAPYLLHWEALKEAQKKGCQFYDFWGIDYKKWPGLTRFKNSFSGEKISYPGSFDFIISSKWYFLYRLGKLIKKFK